MEQQTYTIREMSERFGLPASTLRYYEEIGLLTDVIHTESKKRIYTQQHIDCMTALLNPRNSLLQAHRSSDCGDSGVFPA